MKNPFKTLKKQRLIHINYSDWFKDSKGHQCTVGTVRDDNNIILLQFHYFPTSFGAVIEVFKDWTKYFISKIDGLDKADAFITKDYGGLDNGYSIMNIINKYIN